MATVVTRELLRELAAFQAASGCAVSIYADLDPSSTPTIPDMKAKFKALRARAEKEAEERSSSRDCRLALRETLEQVDGWWGEGFERDGAHGFALFASAPEGLFRVLPLAAGPGDSVEIGPSLNLAPLAGAVEHRMVVVAVVSRERGSVYRLEAGALREVADESAEQRGRHDQGGWSQANYQRHIDELVLQHLRTVGGELDRRVRRDDVQLVLVAPEELRGELGGRLSSEAQAAVVGWATVESHAGPAEVLAAVRPLLDEVRARTEHEALARWEEERSRGGRATGGLRETLEAASDGRVELLLLGAGHERPAWRCPTCGRGFVMSGTCPLDGGRLEEQANGSDLAVQQTLLHDGDVALIDAETLADAGGIGALTRY